MAITYTTPDGVAVTTLAELADHIFDTSGEDGGDTPTTAEVIVYGHRKPGTTVS